MKHRSYDHIQGLWHDKTVNYFREMGFFADNIEWCVMEKIHGSNFAICQTTNSVQFATRNEFIKGDKQFCQHLRMTPDVVNKCTDIWNDMINMGFDLKELIIYGEIFGGKYLHPDLKPIVGVKRIQKGVQYHPDIKFYAFDIWMKTGAWDGYLDYDFATELFEGHKLFYAKILKQGTFAECSIYPNKFPTTIPALLNLPTIEDNICEGIVMKPILPILDANGDRVSLKSKNEDALKKMRERRPRNMKPNKELSPEVIRTVGLILPYINEYRLRMVLSKQVEVTKKDFNRIYKEFRQDIYLDFDEDNNELCILEEIDRKMLDKEIGRLCIDIWRPIFLKEVL